MSLRATTRCNAYRLGRLGRRRNYKCRQCGVKYRTDFLLRPLEDKYKICPVCRRKKEEHEPRYTDQRRDVQAPAG